MRTQSSHRNDEPRMPKCSGGFVSADLKAFLDSELSPLRAWYVRRHVSHCHAFVTKEVVWLQRLGKNMRLLEDAKPRPELRARILSTLPQMEMSSVQPVVSVPSRRVGAFGYVFAGAFCLLIVAGAFAAWRSTGIANITNGPDRIDNTAANGPARKFGSKSAAPTTSPNHASALVIQPLPRDPTSEKADELYAMGLKKEKEQAAMRLPAEWKRAITTVRTASTREKQGAQSYVQVAMGVQNVAAAQKQLIDWAHSAKACVRILPDERTAHRYASLLLTVSPASGAALLSQLRRLEK